MYTRVFSSALALICVTGGSHSTDYSKERALRVTSEFEMRSETTSTVERDGQPSESPMGAMSSSQKRRTVHVDRVVEHEDGAPKKVRRHFEELKHEGTMSFGDQERSDEREGALVDVTLELTRGEDDEVEIKVVEGDEPVGEALEGHRLELALDALLPDGDVEAGAEWKPDSDAVKRALGVDLSNVLFPPPAPEEPQGGEGGSGRGRGRSSRGPSMTSALMQQADWECTAKLTDGETEFEGAKCVTIELEMSAEGSMPEPEGGSSGGRMFGGAFAVYSFARPENSYEIKLEGKLLFDTARRMPVRLELEGTLSMENHMEYTRNESTMKIDSQTEGEIAIEITLAEEKSE